MKPKVQFCFHESSTLALILRYIKIRMALIPITLRSIIIFHRKLKFPRKTYHYRGLKNGFFYTCYSSKRWIQITAAPLLDPPEVLDDNVLAL
jgi:hypothetical protein